MPTRKNWGQISKVNHNRTRLQTRNLQGAGQRGPSAQRSLGEQFLRDALPSPQQALDSIGGALATENPAQLLELGANIPGAAFGALERALTGSPPSSGGGSQGSLLNTPSPLSLDRLLESPGTPGSVSGMSEIMRLLDSPAPAAETETRSGEAGGAGGLTEARPSSVISPYEPFLPNRRIETYSTTQPWKMDIKAWKINMSLDPTLLWCVIKFDPHEVRYQLNAMITNMEQQPDVQNSGYGGWNENRLHSSSQTAQYRLKTLGIQMLKFKNPVAPYTGYAGQLARESVRIKVGIFKDQGAKTHLDVAWGEECLNNNASNADTILHNDQEPWLIDAIANSGTKWMEVGMDSKWWLNLMPRYQLARSIVQTYKTTEAYPTSVPMGKHNEYRYLDEDWISKHELVNSNSEMWNNLHGTFVVMGIDPDYWPQNISTSNNPNPVTIEGQIKIEIESKNNGMWAGDHLVTGKTA